MTEKKLVVEGHLYDFTNEQAIDASLKQGFVHTVQKLTAIEVIAEFGYMLGEDELNNLS